MEKVRQKQEKVTKRNESSRNVVYKVQRTAQSLDERFFLRYNNKVKG